jgi:hypothetical protein
LLKGVLSIHPDLLNLLDDTEIEKSTSKKNLGNHTRLHHWSRGHLFFYHPYDHIDFWQPIYQYVNNTNACVILHAEMIIIT